VTETGPGPAPIGTTATIWVALQLVMLIAGIVSNATVLLLCDGPKPLPLIVKEEPMIPVDAEMLVIETELIRLKVTPPLVTPLAATVTLPLDAPDGTVTVMLVPVHDPTLATTEPKFT
jgi:hypothetical protein